VGYIQEGGKEIYGKLPRTKTRFGRNRLPTKKKKEKKTLLLFAEVTSWTNGATSCTVIQELPNIL
jgi:hypothetical protein